MDIEECVRIAVDVLPGAVANQFAIDPFASLTTGLGLTVTAVDDLSEQRDDGGSCDGLSFLQDGVILYAPTPYSRRENFTLAHELGHWLVEQAPRVYDWLADQDEPAHLLETICDRIAQTLLLPDAAAKAIVGSGPIRARQLFQLYDATQASRRVCAIALANQLPGLAAVVIIDARTGNVTHASVRPDPERGWPRVFPWRGQTLGTRHPLTVLQLGKSMTRRLTWRTPWDAQAEYYVDAVGDGVRVVAVLSAHDAWNSERLHAPIEREFDTRPLLAGRCCGEPFERRGYPCSTCHQPFCPRCGKCPCERDAAREVTCTMCFLKFQPHLVVDGRCVECRS